MEGRDRMVRGNWLDGTNWPPKGSSVTNTLTGGMRGMGSALKPGFRSWWKWDAVKSGGCPSEQGKQSWRVKILLWLSTSDMAGCSGDRGWWLAQPKYSTFFAVFLPTLCMYSWWRADSEWILSHGKLWLKRETFLCLYYIPSYGFLTCCHIKNAPFWQLLYAFFLSVPRTPRKGKGKPPYSVVAVLWLSVQLSTTVWCVGKLEA